ncbi:NF-kappa-B essential modulator isoform X2 [Aethina tumida]|uniref:NF-kappa-B essential modulator isoform X2 n=1 Tax=Aethina tumida TaxID=116153 RepID=UPI002148F14F|nr:NF-kappa-B essential modulator isoform X2 [Aethina tumida]
MASAIESPLKPTTSLLSDDTEEESFVILSKSIDPNFESMSFEQDDEMKSINLGKQIVNDFIQNEMTTSSNLPPMPVQGFDVDKENVDNISNLSNESLPGDIQAKISELIEENNKLKNTIMENNNSMKSQKDRILVWQEEVKNVFAANKQQFKEAKEIIESQKKEIAKLMQQQMVTSGEKTKQVSTLTNQCAELSLSKNEQQLLDVQAEVKRLQIQLKKEMDEKAQFQDELNKLKESQMNKCQELERELANQVNKFQKEINDKVASNNMLSMEMEILKKKLQAPQEISNLGSLQEEITKLKGQLDSSTKYIEQLKIENGHLQEINSSVNEQLVNVQEELMATNVTLNNLNKKMQEMKEQLSVKEAFVEELQNKQKIAEDKNAVFQMQMDVYKADFEAERSAREVLVQEREQLNEDLQNVHRRNQQLLEEIELVRKNTDWVVPPGNSRASPAPSATYETQTHTFACPLCNKKFRSARMVEEHIDHCPNLSP